MNVAANSSEIVRVELGMRSYDIVIGAGVLSELGTRIRRLSRRDRLFVLADATVLHLHGTALEASLAHAGFRSEMVRLPPGENSKSWPSLRDVVETVLARRPERSDLVVAFGGGVTGDVAGFAASILLRGLAIVQVPTTLLAQVDSAVGGKTAINSEHGKNLIGTFHQPCLVVADTSLIDTLARRDRLAGYAEIAKYALIDDPEFFFWLERNALRVIDEPGTERTHAVVASCRAKAAIVAADESEAGRRALLNLGHTFAHAIETETGFADTVRHGEAVALGICLAFDLSAALGSCAGADALRVRRHFEAVGLPTHLRQLREAGGFDAQRLLAAMMGDKKVRSGRPTFILVKRIGAAYVADDVPLDRVRDLLEAEIRGQGSEIRRGTAPSL